MGGLVNGVFPEAGELAVGGLLFMMSVYGYILFQASTTISQGCEMLLLLYGPGIIGGLLIPILGAVPDCMVILLSGLGPGTQEEVAYQLSVGVGTLVGSTVMLITLPWAAGVLLGRRDFDPVRGAATTAKPVCTKLSLTESCVTVVSGIPRSAQIMMLSSLSYLIIQVPAFFYKSDADHGVLRERKFALTGLAVTCVAFISYCIYQWLSAASEEAQRFKEAAMRRNAWRANLDHRFSRDDVQDLVFAKFDRDKSGYMEQGELAAALQALGLAEVGRRDVAEIIEEIDMADAESGKKDGKISREEFKLALKTWMSPAFFETMSTSASKANSGRSSHSSSRSNLLARANRRSTAVTTGAHHAASAHNLTGRKSPTVHPRSSNTKNGSSTSGAASSNYGAINEAEIHQLLNQHKRSLSQSHNDGDDLDQDEIEEEEEEEEEAYWELTEGQLKLKALGLLLMATVVVTIVSDPMVDVISQLGTRLSVSPFYISFLVTPLASNASEVISGIVFARKKTTESISVSLASLHGAATMNSTLGLCIFLCLVYFRELAWSFSAEVLAVVLTMMVVGLNALSTNIFLWQAIVVAVMYPMAILFVYVCENVFGLD